jgi:hypothetical protein
MTVRIRTPNVPVDEYFTVSGLTNMIKSSKANYCFYRCLHPDDQVVFIEGLVGELSSLDRESYDCTIRGLWRGGLRMTTWVRVMGSIELTHEYRLSVQGRVIALGSGDPIHLAYDKEHIRVLDDPPNAEMISKIDFTDNDMAYGNTPTHEDYDALVEYHAKSTFVIQNRNLTPSQNPLLSEDGLRGTLIECMALGKNFTYIRCLRGEDQGVFIEELVRLLRVRVLSGESSVEQTLARIHSGGITFDDRSTTMMTCTTTKRFKSNYVLYRTVGYVNYMLQTGNPSYFGVAARSYGFTTALDYPVIKIRFDETRMSTMESEAEVIYEFYEIPAEQVIY